MANLIKKIFGKQIIHPDHTQENVRFDLNKMDLNDPNVLLDVAKVCQKLIWGTYEQRKFFESNGIHLAPANFYSGLPTLNDIENSFEEAVKYPFLDSIQFESTFLKNELESLIPYSNEFDFPMEGDENNPKCFFVNNSQFSHSDCFAYYSIIRKYRPNKIVEIGSGFSSLLAKEALKRNGKGKLICYEPFPRPFLSLTTDELIQKKIQDCTTDEIVNRLSDGDILFIDSTHTVKAGSDCLWIYLKLFPALLKSKKRLMIHAHDIFLPNAMPTVFTIGSRLSWTEQYLLLAFLIGNDKAQIFFPVEYHRIFNGQSLKKLKKNYETNGEGGSFWFQLNGESNL